jgi:hypothetical protein
LFPTVSWLESSTSAHREHPAHFLPSAALVAPQFEFVVHLIRIPRVCACPALVSL